jgi:FMN-dependent NADH-azoreductase
VGFYNFGIPSQVKAWVDRLAVVGKTFRYTAKGPEGLAGGKRVILAISRGGFYGPGSPTHSLEHAETYLRGVFAFFGIPQVEVVSAEGVAIGPEARQSAIAKAQAHIEALAA